MLKRGRRWELLTPTEKLMGHALRRRKLVRFFEAADGRWIEATLDGVLAAS
ncbi:hypothetical protein CcrBL47_gp402 [Caulobacter phage BL47]|nr:hypothetical protein CcrBL47_gp402 [Caulobacter phage BL47]